MRSRRAIAALALATAFAACSHTRRAEPPAATSSRPEAPDRPEERGVPPAPGRPRVPSSPEGLLSEGAVGRIQRALAERGYLGEHRGGELDAPTSAALRKFQEVEGLAATGFPDRETLRRLGVDPDRAYGRAGDRPR